MQATVYNSPEHKLYDLLRRAEMTIVNPLVHSQELWEVNYDIWLQPQVLLSQRPRIVVCTEQTRLLNFLYSDEIRYEQEPQLFREEMYARAGMPPHCAFDLFVLHQLTARRLDTPKLASVIRQAHFGIPYNRSTENFDPDCRHEPNTSVLLPFPMHRVERRLSLLNDMQH